MMTRENVGRIHKTVVAFLHVILFQSLTNLEFKQVLCDLIYSALCLFKVAVALYSTNASFLYK